jgi:hypothetical protein
MVPCPSFPASIAPIVPFWWVATPWEVRLHTRTPTETTSVVRVGAVAAAVDTHPGMHNIQDRPGNSHEAVAADIQQVIEREDTLHIGMAGRRLVCADILGETLLLQRIPC